MSFLYVFVGTDGSGTLSREGVQYLMLSDPLAVFGVFMMGASTGALVMHVKYRGLLKEFRKALEVNLSPRQPARDESPIHHGSFAVTGGDRVATKTALPIA